MAADALISYIIRASAIKVLCRMNNTLGSMGKDYNYLNHPREMIENADI